MVGLGGCVRWSSTSAKVAVEAFIGLVAVNNYFTVIIEIPEYPNVCPYSPILETNSKLIEKRGQEYSRCFKYIPLAARCHEVYLSALRQ